MKTQSLLKRIAAALMVAVCLTAFALAACAGNRGGAQAVVFPHWNSTSVNNLVAAVNESLPAEFELSQCPFFGGDNRWANTVTLLKGVNSGVGLVGTFFLSFHTDKPGYDLARRAANLNAFLTASRSDLGNQTPVARLKNVVLSPQLEDNWSDDTWKAKVKVMLDQMDENKVLKSGKLTLRRSVNPGISSSLNGATYTYRRGNNSYPLRIRVEQHKFASVPSTGSWSNDGDFVYFPNSIGGVREDANSAVDGQGAISARKPLSDCIATARNRSGATTLWRPSMNLWRRTVSNGKVIWTRDGSLPKPWERTDTNTSFDAREKAALKAFLNGLK